MSNATTGELPSANSITTSYSADILALAARILLAAIFVLSGIAKLADPQGTIGYIASVGLPLPEAAYAGAVGLELIGGLALIVGFKTRYVAAALAGFSIAAAFLFHFNLADQNQFVHFFKNVAMAGGLLQIVAFGPGRWAIDKS